MKEGILDLEIITERLVLKEIEAEDSEFIINLRSNYDVYKYFLNPHKITVKEHLNWFYNIYCSDNNRIEFIAELRDKTAVGIFGLKRITEENCAEISYILGPNSYGKGYAKEALEKLFELYKIYWNLDFYIATIHEKNENSRRFIKKQGFKLDSKIGDFYRYIKYF